MKDGWVGARRNALRMNIVSLLSPGFPSLLRQGARLLSRSQPSRPPTEAGRLLWWEGWFLCRPRCRDYAMMPVDVVKMGTLVRPLLIPGLWSDLRCLTPVELRLRTGRIPFYKSVGFPWRQSKYPALLGKNTAHTGLASQHLIVWSFERDTAGDSSAPQQHQSSASGCHRTVNRISLTKDLKALQCA